MNTLTTDYARCAEVLRGSGSSFALPIRLLPFQKRQSTTALYAFCRRADDIVDNTHDPLAARVALEGFEQSLAAGLAGCRSEDPVLRALVDTVRRYAIPPALLYDILAGVRMDLDRQTYDTFANLEEYCRRVASAVGLAAIHIWGFRGAEALPAAHSCGLAFQLTNILRDIPEDLRRGRIYLPEEDFQACGCTSDDLRLGQIHAGFSRLAAAEFARAEGFYEQSQALDKALSTDGRLVFRAMYGVYRSLLAAVGRAGPAIFTTRIRPSRPVVIASAVATILTGIVRPRGFR